MRRLMKTTSQTYEYSEGIGSLGCIQNTISTIRQQSIQIIGPIVLDGWE
jgi:hypothetical protein